MRNARTLITSCLACTVGDVISSPSGRVLAGTGTLAGVVTGGCLLAGVRRSAALAPVAGWVLVAASTSVIRQLVTHPAGSREARLKAIRTRLTVLMREVPGRQFSVVRPELAQMAQDILETCDLPVIPVLIAMDNGGVEVVWRNAEVRTSLLISGSSMIVARRSHRVDRRFVKEVSWAGLETAKNEFSSFLKGCEHKAAGARARSKALQVRTTMVSTAVKWVMSRLLVA